MKCVVFAVLLSALLDAARANEVRLIELYYHSVDDSTFWHQQPVASALVDEETELVSAAKLRAANNAARQTAGKILK